MWAAVGGKIDIVKVLVQHGANVNSRSKHKESVVHLAIRNSYTDIVKILVDNGASIDVRDDSSATPFMCAVRKGDIRTAKLLLDLGTVDVNDTACVITLTL
jgi:ankyrin repeat protein